MTLAEIKKIREEAGTDKPMIIIGDNEHIFYHNVNDSCVIIWDDELERIISFEKNITSAQSQAIRPARVVYTSYEHIQYIEVITTIPEVLTILNKFKDKMTDEHYQYCIKFYSSIANAHMCAPGTLPKKPEEADA